jgi:hypothetical protein
VQLSSLQKNIYETVKARFNDDYLLLSDQKRGAVGPNASLPDAASDFSAQAARVFLVVASNN